jgi:hypothetical protein
MPERSVGREGRGCAHDGKGVMSYVGFATMNGSFLGWRRIGFVKL